MSENNVGKLYERIAQVSKDIGSLVPDKRNTDQKYDYISADKILERAGRAMADAGLVVAPSITTESCEMVEYESYGKKKTRYDAVLEFDMLIADADGNAVTQHWISRGTDYVTPDKALYKAITSGHKYFLMKLFNVGVGNEDGEHEAEPGDSAPTQTRQQPPQDTRGATSPQKQAERKRPAAPKAKSNGKDTDWKAKALAAKSLATFASAASLGLDQYTSEQHVTNALESVEGFEYNAVKNETYWNWLKERKETEAD